jgi:endonuclease/exonuclease/phosphatase (EEP) superfamily protein YafD
MSFSLLSYNVLWNKAYVQIEQIIKEEKPDIICLQEIETAESNLKKFENSRFRLADYTNSFIKFARIFGLATFYNPEKFSFINSSAIKLPQSLYEIFLIILRGINPPRTALKTDFLYKSQKKKISIYNLHLTALQATNTVRIKQLNEVLHEVKNGIKQSVILAGDFNYPYGRKKFERLIRRYHLKEATNNLFYTLEYNFLNLFRYRAKTDYILYKHIKLLETKRIPIRNSDHFPILSKFDLKQLV